MYLSGMGDLSGLMDKIQNVMPADELVPNLTGAFTLRLLYQMFQNFQNMGPLGQVSYPFIDLNLNKFFGCVIMISFRGKSLLARGRFELSTAYSYNMS